jgi:hypothetical protein
MAGPNQTGHHGPAHPAGTDAPDFSPGVLHQEQGGVGRVEHGPAGDTRGTGKVGDQALILLQQILWEQRSGKAGKPFQTAGVTAKDVERVPVPAAVRDDLAETVRQDTEGPAECQRGGRRSQVGGEQQVVEQFGGLSGPQIPNDRVGVGLQNRAAALHDLRVATGHTSSRPASTAGAPPLTGASITETSCSAACLANFRHVSGCTVLCTAMMLPGLAPANSPLSPPVSSSTSASPTTHRQISSLAAASSAGDPATSAAVTANGSSDTDLRAHSVIG